LQDKELIAFIDNPERLRNFIQQEPLIDNSGRLRNFIQQEPLIATKPSLEGIANMQQPPNSLFFGVGLVSKGQLSEGLPIDVLSMLLIAERLDVQGNKYLYIADVHARVTTPPYNKGRFDRDNWDYLWYHAEGYATTFDKIIKNLGFSNWQIVRASDFYDAEMQKLISSWIVDKQSSERIYDQLELADIEAFEKKANVKLKIGWAFDSGGNLDETYFDRLYKERFPQSEMSFLYVKPGMTFNPKKLRMSPYFCDDVNARVEFFVGSLVDYGHRRYGKIERAREKYGKQGIQCYLNYLKNLVRLFDSVVEPTKKGPLEQKLREVFGRCLLEEKYLEKYLMRDGA